MTQINKLQFIVASIPCGFIHTTLQINEETILCLKLISNLYFRDRTGRPGGKGGLITADIIGHRGGEVKESRFFADVFFERNVGNGAHPTS